MPIQSSLSNLTIWQRHKSQFNSWKLTLMMFPAVLSLSVWSSCSDESVSSKACSSSSEGKRALRYGMELGCAAITAHSQRDGRVNACKKWTYILFIIVFDSQTDRRWSHYFTSDVCWINTQTLTYMGRWWRRLWTGCESPQFWPWSEWAHAPRPSAGWRLSPSALGSRTRALWTSGHGMRERVVVSLTQTDRLCLVELLLKQHWRFLPG